MSRAKGRCVFCQLAIVLSVFVFVSGCRRQPMHARYSRSEAGGRLRVLTSPGRGAGSKNKMGNHPKIPKKFALASLNFVLSLNTCSHIIHTVVLLYSALFFSWGACCAARRYFGCSCTLPTWLRRRSTSSGVTWRTCSWTRPAVTPTRPAAISSGAGESRCP